MSCGLPSWASLIERLFEIHRRETSTSGVVTPLDAVNSHFGNAANLVTGRYIAKMFPNDLAQQVKNCLYDTENCERSLTSAIAHFAHVCAMERNPGIVTFNYDDILERFIEENMPALNPKPVYSEGYKLKRSQLPIYHVHGYLPKSGPVPSGAHLILSEEAYHGRFEDAFSWSNLVQISAYVNNCIFIGLSFNDPNLRRLLDVAAKRSVSREPKHVALMMEPTGIPDQEREYVKYLRESDANSLGVRILWYKDHKALPELVRNLATAIS